jgi:hypothetical protein
LIETAVLRFIGLTLDNPPETLGFCMVSGTARGSIAESLPISRGRDTTGALENTRQVLLAGEAAGKRDLRNISASPTEALSRSFNSPPQKVLVRSFANGQTELAGEMADAQAGSLGNSRQPD